VAARNGEPDEILGELYPFEDKTVELRDGHQMHYIEAGHAGWSRPTFLLLHGNPTWSFLWRRVMGPLSRIGRVVAVDHVGFGRSDHPSEKGYYSLERHIRNLEEFAAQTKLRRTVVVMMDWGGPIGLGWATRHPENVAGLVLFNTWAFTEKVPMRLPLSFRALRARGVGELAFGRRNMFVDSFIPRLLVNKPSAAVMEAYRHPFPSSKSRVGVVQSPRMIPTKPGDKDWATMDRIEKSLPNLDVPARIIWGERDPAFGKRFAWAFHESLPKSEKPRFYPEAGHYFVEDLPDVAAAQIVEFAAHLS
jgi:pimeloyl-ACP methyl ester carboxylesterase